MKHLSKICLIVWCLLLATSLHVVASSDGYNDRGQSSPSMGGSQGQTDKEQDSPSMGNTEGQNDSEEDNPSLQPKTLLGDVNGDGVVDAMDGANIVAYYLAKDKTTIVGFDVANADVNGDNVIDSMDASKIVEEYLKNR